MENALQLFVLRGFLRWLVLWSLEFGVKVFHDFSVLTEEEMGRLVWAGMKASTRKCADPSELMQLYEGRSPAWTP